MTTEERPLKRSAGIVIVRTENDRCLFLLLRSFNYWDFPKGEVEADEDPLQTAIREVEEETGLTRLTFPWSRDYYETRPYRTGKFLKIARYYLARTDQKDIKLGISPELGEPEHHEWRWMTLQEARKHLKPRLRSVLDWAIRIINCDT